MLGTALQTQAHPSMACLLCSGSEGSEPQLVKSRRLHSFNICNSIKIIIDEQKKSTKERSCLFTDRNHLGHVALRSSVLSWVLHPHQNQEVKVVPHIVF